MLYALTGSAHGPLVPSSGSYQHHLTEQVGLIIVACLHLLHVCKSKLCGVMFLFLFGCFAFDQTEKEGTLLSQPALVIK